MPSFTSSLFLGLPKTETYDQALRAADQELVWIFLSNDGQYLHEVEYQDVKYIGKPVGEITDMKTLLLLESNIYSLLKKLFPDIQVTNTPLKLIAIPQ